MIQYYNAVPTCVQVVIAQTRAKAASTLTEVSWCGKKLPVKSEKVRICLVHLRELSDEAQRKSDDDTACEQLCEQIVLECHDAMQTLRDELSQDKVCTVCVCVCVCVCVVCVCVCACVCVCVCACVCMCVCVCVCVWCMCGLSYLPYDSLFVGIHV